MMPTSRTRKTGKLSDTAQRARVFAVVAAAWLGAGVADASAQSIVPDSSIDLPSVPGRIDHMTVDADGERLFVRSGRAHSGMPACLSALAYCS